MRPPIPTNLWRLEVPHPIDSVLLTYRKLKYFDNFLPIQYFQVTLSSLSIQSHESQCKPNNNQNLLTLGTIYVTSLFEPYAVNHGRVSAIGVRVV